MTAAIPTVQTPTDASPENESLLPYQPALDGLRAIAVIAVLLYHGGSQWFPGGFLGVDVFFVLSGYLITSLLLAEWEVRHSLDLTRFWARRARRLLPALLLTLLLTAVMAVLIGGEFARSVREDGLASLFYVSNWWFIAQGSSYVADLGNQSPLTHTWSLAIEEQWYLFLPLVLVIVLPRLRSRWQLAVGLVAVAVMSATVMWLVAPAGAADPSRVYFGTDTRVQGLLIGGALACVAPYLVRSRLISWGALGATAMLLLALLTVSFDDPTMYRGGFALVAVGVAIVIAAVTVHPGGRLAHALSVPPMVAIGKISYGLYLWHWPVYILLSPERTGLSGLGLLAVRLVLTTGLAAASYHLVELPIRHGALGRLKPGVRTMLVIGAPLAVVTALLVAPLLAAPADKDSLSAIAQRAQQGAGVPGARQNAPRVVLLGDSQALALSDLYPADMTDLAVTPALRFGCGLVPYEADIEGQRMTIPQECGPWGTGDYRDAVREADADVGVMLVGSWEQYDRWTQHGPLPYTDTRWSQLLTQAYDERLDELREATGKVAIVLNHCHGAPQFDAPLQVQFAAGRYPPVVNDPARIEAVNEAARRAAAQQPYPVKVLDPNPTLCPGGYRETLDGVVLRTDGLHLSEGGARFAWEYLEPRLARIAETAHRS